MNRLLFLLTLLTGIGCQTHPGPQIASPNDRIVVEFFLDQGGVPGYLARFDGQTLLDSSSLGLSLRGSPDLIGGFAIERIDFSSQDTIWETVWGEQRLIRDHHREMRVALRDAEGRTMILRFRVFNDGLAFRYEVPLPEGADSLWVEEELTTFKVNPQARSWTIPADYDSYEYRYTPHLVSEIEAGVHTPLTIENPDGSCLSIHEAALTDYASMTLEPDPERTGNLHCTLVPWPDGLKVRLGRDLISPWRVVLVADVPRDLITSTMILNLNEPSKIEDPSWIKFGKYIGIWWGMHLEKYTWGYGPRHGATNPRTKAYIDFAAENGLGGVLVEGWNLGWGGEKEAGIAGFPGRMDYLSSYPDFDLEAMSAYAREKGVYLIGHHETYGDVVNYENQLLSALDLYARVGVPVIKTGYVGKMATPRGHFHHGQWMVNHYRRVVEEAAARQIAIVAHEPIKPTGIRRTWPNMLSREGVRGQEYNAAWATDGGNLPGHSSVLPFTRMLAGPIDYTSGFFQLDLQPYGIFHTRVKTTLAHQLALFVVIYSPVQMAADLIENYQGEPAFEFIRKVPTNWDTTIALAGSIGEHVVIARRERNGKRWFLGAVAGEEGCDLRLDLSFLEAGKSYRATLFSDLPNANWEKGFDQIEISTREVNPSSAWSLKLAAGGGEAWILEPRED